MIEAKYSNVFVSKLLKEVAAAYEVTGEDPFRVRAYQNAAASIEHATSEVKDLWEEGKLREIPGIGASIASHLDEYFRTGKVKHFEEVKSAVPEGMFGLFGLEGIGAKTAYKLAQNLNIKKAEQAVEIVGKAAREGKLQHFEGFGEKKEAEILEAVVASSSLTNGGKRALLPMATEVSERFLKYLRQYKEVLRAEPLGSLRRRVATIGDIDLAISTTQPKKVIDLFVSFREVGKVLNEGDEKASVLLNNGLRVDLMTSRPEAFGALLQHFTGSKAHNIALRKYAMEKGFSLSEHGVKRGGKTTEFASEEDFYRFLELKYIEPELREDAGEVEASKSGKLPTLIKVEDIKGDLHSHTVFSDGVNTMEDMVGRAKNLGYSYVGISDHAPSIQVRGESQVMSLIRKTKSNIEQLNNSYDGFRVLFGYEVNILSDATISLPESFLKLLDYSIGSIHTSFGQTRDQITKRLINAINNPYITFIAHPTGRLLNGRESYDANWEEVFKQALGKNKILEINSHPQRLDLPDILVREAVKKGVRLIINTDAHSIDHFGLIRYGIDVARRGWVEKKNVVNALPLKDFLREFLGR